MATVDPAVEFDEIILLCGKVFVDGEERDCVFTTDLMLLRDKLSAMHHAIPSLAAFPKIVCPLT